MVLLALIWVRDNADGISFISEEKLAERAGMGVNALCRSLKRLECEHGIISIVVSES